ncbi:MAG: ATP-dependent Clp protease ATP-binding subunit, partial [Clostridia bacterium]|nr:ATP-dependent Clp protease ATP-binding subunit [Clostridia bacterium]
DCPCVAVSAFKEIRQGHYSTNTIAKRVQQTFISTEHLLLALLSQNDSIAIKILAGMYKLNVREMRDRLVQILSKSPTSEAKPNQNFNADGYEQVGNVKNRAYEGNDLSNDNDQSTLPQELLDMGSDVTLRARMGKIDPIIGRDEEIERVIEILCRKTKNNPVLIGEAGVGKSAIIEGLALKIVKNDVPQILRGKTIYSLDIGGLMAGTKYRGSMEEKLKNAIDTIINDQNIIVFIDEIHTLAMAGSDKGETSPADMLKPYLARGEMQTIGATTTDEYRKYIEKDKALERRFQPIMVNPPSVEDTIAILKGLRDSYEAFHNVKILDDAIEAAVKLSDKYILDRSLPDKAIDLIDEASSRAKVLNNYASQDTVDIEKRLQTLEANKQDAIIQEDFEKATRLRDEIAQTKQELETLKSNRTSAERNEIVIDDNAIAEIVSKWTQIPLTKLTESEGEKLMQLEAKLKSRVIGQDEAINLVSRAIRRSRLGIRDGRRPIGSFLFLGSTGVGKTELCKALADALYDNENQMIRLDMSEFMESHSVSKLIGAPPGYVGFDEGGQLTEKVRRKPYSIVLFDEVEKAHPDVMNILLQILDDGRLTDTQGRTVSFKNCVIILTSNIGSDKLASKRIDFGFNQNTETSRNELVMEELKRRFRPEFINRLDNIIIFNRLGHDDMVQITKNMLVNVSKTLAEQNIGLKLTDTAVDYLVNKGSNEEYGARPMRRLIMTEIEDELADMLLRGDLNEKRQVLIDSDGTKLIFNLQ